MALLKSQKNNPLFFPDDQDEFARGASEADLYKARDPFQPPTEVTDAMQQTLAEEQEVLEESPVDIEGVLGRYADLQKALEVDNEREFMAGTTNAFQKINEAIANRAGITNIKHDPIKPGPRQVDQLLKAYKGIAALQPRATRAITPLDQARIDKIKAETEALKGKKPGLGFEEKEQIKEDVKVRTENRKNRKDAEKDLENTEKLIEMLEDTQAAFEQYSKNKWFGTGPIATLGGVKTFVDEPTEMLDAKFKAQNLDTMSKMFQGMSKAIDSEAERRAFEAAQPSITNDDNTNREIIQNRLRMAKSLLAKQKDYLNKTDRYGNFIDYEAKESVPGMAIPPKSKESVPGMAIPPKSNVLSEQDRQQALEWANANPEDPRSAKIKRKLGM